MVELVPGCGLYSYPATLEKLTRERKITSMKLCRQVVRMCVPPEQLHTFTSLKQVDTRIVEAAIGKSIMHVSRLLFNKKTDQSQASLRWSSIYYFILQSKTHNSVTYINEFNIGMNRKF